MSSTSTVMTIIIHDVAHVFEIMAKDNNSLVLIDVGLEPNLEVINFMNALLDITYITGPYPFIEPS